MEIQIREYIKNIFVLIETIDEQKNIPVIPDAVNKLYDLVTLLEAKISAIKIKCIKNGYEKSFKYFINDYGRIFDIERNILTLRYHLLWHMNTTAEELSKYDYFYYYKLSNKINKHISGIYKLNRVINSKKYQNY